ncbi:MAG: radical SAM family heme chaperone HemW [Planctomycetes bacterium]|nr:radical SAM family heme chaperone HemW [Planctomycetota bacterium]
MNPHALPPRDPVPVSHTSPSVARPLRAAAPRPDWIDRCRPPAPPVDLGVYVHVPFCISKCPYCAFNTIASDGRLHEGYVRAVCRELREAGEACGRLPAATVFFGGGTPTFLRTTELEAILDAVRSAFPLAPGAEITVEANPGTADAELFADLRRLGINRLSMGVQSLDPAELRFLGRAHGAEEAVRAYRMARAAGFDNVNLDFMFALPGQSVEKWLRTLGEAVALAPEHLSAYCLTLEEGTDFWKAVRAGRLALPDPEVQADFIDATVDFLEARGYPAYEVSNYSLPGRECRHNLRYWSLDPYLGFGPGAHSFWQGRRFSIVGSIPEYIERIDAGRRVRALDEELSPEQRVFEAIYVGLRKRVGVDRGDFGRRFGLALDDVYGDRIPALVADGLVVSDDRGIRLTRRGLLVADAVTGQFCLT